MDAIPAVASNSPFTEIIPEDSYNSNAQLQAWANTRSWGHHASCSCPIGKDGDNMDVLDSAFRVRGTKGLRVEDVSAFPRIPGFFVVLPVMMISEKAADVILKDAKSS